MQKKMNRVGEIWKDLSAIDVNAYTYKINGLDYLPWARAVGILMDRYPDMEYRFIEFEDSSGNKQFFNSVPAGDGTFTGIVAVEVCVEGISKKMVLPIMSGFKNSSVINPSAKDITNSLMRCLAKCIAMFGLGHSLYAGDEDITDEIKSKGTPKRSGPGGGKRGPAFKLPPEPIPFDTSAQKVVSASINEVLPPPAKFNFE